MELPEAQQVGPVHHQRVDGRHVDARLDDGGAYQDVIPAVPEVHDHRLQGGLIHLAVGYGHPGLRNQLTDPARHLVDVMHPVVYEEDLTFPE